MNATAYCDPGRTVPAADWTRTPNPREERERGISFGVSETMCGTGRCGGASPFAVASLARRSHVSNAPASTTDSEPSTGPTTTAAATSGKGLVVQSTKKSVEEKSCSSIAAL